MQNAGVLLFLTGGHLPAKIAQVRPHEKEMGQAKINLGDEPFDLGEAQQWIERLAHSLYRQSVAEEFQQFDMLFRVADHRTDQDLEQAVIVILARCQ